MNKILMAKGLFRLAPYLCLLTTGCATLDSGIHEVLRHDEAKNTVPLADVLEIDYSEYDNTHEFKVVDNRAHLKNNSAPESALEKIVDVPQSIKYTIPAINASYIENNDGGIILQYKSRVPAGDLQELIKKHLKEIEVETYSNQNTLIFTGKKQAFGDFKYLTNLLNEFDIPAMQLRLKLRIVEYFNDNTYDRELSLKMLKDKMNAVSLILPSNPDPTAMLNMGIDVNPFYNHNKEDYDFESAVKFLDSHGKTNILSDLDLLVSNGQSVEFINTTSIPYPKLMEGKTGWIESIEYMDTGAKVKITPYANEQGFITLKLENAESGEHTGYYGTLQRPTFRTANLKSEFTIRNGITYFAGTSLFTRYKSVDRGIPLINKIPVLGHLFMSRSIESSQSQLLYFVEARVIDRDSLVGTQIRK